MVKEEKSPVKNLVKKEGFNSGIKGLINKQNSKQGLISKRFGLF
jgi:hypothetical protein